MAAPSEGFWQRRGALGLYELILTWWRHRVSFLISVAITLGALTLYYFTFFGEKTTPIFAFLQRFEYNSLDTRFRYRPANANRPAIARSAGQMALLPDALRHHARRASRRWRQSSLLRRDV